MGFPGQKLSCSHLSTAHSSQPLTLPYVHVPRVYCKVTERDPKKDNKDKPKSLSGLRTTVMCVQHLR